MFCPTCSQHAHDDLRYCSRCGTRLDLIANYLSDPDKQLRRDKQSLTGITLILVTVFLLLINFIIYGATSLPHITNSGFFFWLWVINIVTALAIGGTGAAKLIRSGFFRELKERDLRVQMAELEQKYKKLERREMVEPPSVTEATTIKLRPKHEEDAVHALDNETR